MGSLVNPTDEKAAAFLRFHGIKNPVMTAEYLKQLTLLHDHGSLGLDGHKFVWTTNGGVLTIFHTLEELPV